MHLQVLFSTSVTEERIHPLMIDINRKFATHIGVTSYYDPLENESEDTLVKVTYEGEGSEIAIEAELRSIIKRHGFEDSNIKFCFKKPSPFS